MLWQFLVALVILGLLKGGISYLIPDVPKKFLRVQGRHEFIAHKILETNPLMLNKDFKVLPNKLRYGLFKKY